MHTNLLIYFMHWHMRDAIVILEEGNLPHPPCPDCAMFVLWAALNKRHTTTAFCARVIDSKRRQLEER